MVHILIKNLYNYFVHYGLATEMMSVVADGILSVVA